LLNGGKRRADNETAVSAKETDETSDRLDRRWHLHSRVWLIVADDAIASSRAAS
jgi:hypothetical protein